MTLLYRSPLVINPSLYCFSIDQFFLFQWDVHIVDADRGAGFRGIGKAEIFDLIQQGHRFAVTCLPVNRVDQLRHFLFGHDLICHRERRRRWKNFTQQDSPHGCRNKVAVDAHLDFCVFFDFAGIVRHAHFFGRREDLPLTPRARPFFRQPITTQDHILRRHRDWLAVRRRENVIDGHHQDTRFDLRFDRQGHVNRHLVAVKVGVKCRADQWMQPDRLPFHQNRIERLDAETVQRRCTIEQHGMFTNYFIKHIPDFRTFLLDQPLGALNGRRSASRLQFMEDKRLE
jgi:hypothetical protein